MDGRLPVSALLSHALVAFTIEFDNESEHRMPHRRTHGPTADSLHVPWLVSLAMWSNCMQFVGEEGVTVRELRRLARTAANLDGMRRWGYITVESDPADGRPKMPRSAWVIRPTPAGRTAREIWRPLFGVIAKRWQERFGKEEIERLRESLLALVRRIDLDLPDCLPILGYGLFSGSADFERRALAGRVAGDAPGFTLPALLSKVLLTFAIEFERDSDVSLAISANVLRIVGEEGVRVRDLPRLAAVSKEAIAMSVGYLEKHAYAVVGPESPGSRIHLVGLTAKGRKARDAYTRLVGAIEERWKARFGDDIVRGLRELLERLVAAPTLFRGLEPYPSGWRASVRKPAGLPHYPMVLHRGAFPDGS
ncbi:MAG: hypothetical protein ACR2I2_15630 [Bryobacteraceae bacterium]